MAELLQDLLVELERFGEENDNVHSERPRRMLNITRDTGEFLAVLVRATAARRVLEIGTSNGYSTLWLAHAVGATGGAVTTVELSDYKTELARANFSRSGLGGSITLVQDDASRVLERADDTSVDLIFLDSERSEYPDWWPDLKRVLRPGGRLAQLEPVAGPVQPPHFPLTWAREPTDSHLLAAATLREVILATGFIECHWNPVARFPGAAAKRAQAPMTIQRLVMGDRLPAIQEANVRNTDEDRLHTVLAVFERP